MAAATDMVRLDISDKFIKAVYQYHNYSDDVRLQNVKQHLHFVDGRLDFGEIEKVVQVLYMMKFQSVDPVVTFEKKREIEAMTQRMVNDKFAVYGKVSEAEFDRMMAMFFGQNANREKVSSTLGM